MRQQINHKKVPKPKIYKSNAAPTTNNKVNTNISAEITYQICIKQHLPRGPNDKDFRKLNATQGNKTVISVITID